MTSTDHLFVLQNTRMSDFDAWQDARDEADARCYDVAGADRLDLVTGLAWMLTTAWVRLSDAIDFAANPYAPASNPNRWSIATHAVVDEIVMITRLIGPTDPDTVSMRFLVERFDWWTVVHERAGIAAQEFDRHDMQIRYDRYRAGS